jgi:uncharacterized membrane protein YbhN (UPF0104 family)
MKAKDYFKYLFYISLFFLLIKLYRNGLVVLPHITSPAYFFCSLVFLFAGFIWAAIGWKYFLKMYGIEINTRHAIISTGMPVFTKYIPGSIWTVIGAAEYVTSKLNVARRITFTASFNSQMLSLLTGAILAFAGVLLLGKTALLRWGIAISALTIIILLVLFSTQFHKLLRFSILKATRRKIDLPETARRDIVTLMPVYFLFWIFFSISFYMYILSVASTVPWQTAFAFPLAGVFGIIAIFAPGGVGVREGIIAFYLIALGFDAKTATSVSIGSRGVFMIGEFFIFMLAVILNAQKPRS